MPVDRLEKCLRRWHANEVACDIVVSTITSDAEVYSVRSQQRFSLRQDQIGLNRRRRAGDTLRQVLALFDVENSEPFEEWKGP